MDTSKEPTATAAPRSPSNSTTTKKPLIPDPLESTECDHLQAKLSIGRLSEQLALRECRTLRIASNVDAARISYLEARCNYHECKQKDLISELTKADVDCRTLRQQNEVLLHLLQENKASLGRLQAEKETAESRFLTATAEVDNQRLETDKLRKSCCAQDVEISNSKKVAEDFQRQAEEKDKVVESLCTDVRKWRELYETATTTNGGNSGNSGIVSSTPQEKGLPPSNDPIADDSSSDSNSRLTGHLPLKIQEVDGEGIGKTHSFSDGRTGKQSNDRMTDESPTRKRTVVPDNKDNESVSGNKRAKVTRASSRASVPLKKGVDGTIAQRKLVVLTRSARKLAGVRAEDNGGVRTAPTRQAKTVALSRVHCSGANGGPTRTSSGRKKKAQK